MDPETAIALVFGLIILSGAFVIISSMRHRARIVEMAHRERLALIERGIVPQGELAAITHDPPTGRGRRQLSLGIVIVGLGVAVAMLIGFTSREPEVALGVGGAITVVGIAFIVTAVVVHGTSKTEPDFYSSLKSVGERPLAPPVNREPPLS